MTKKYVCHYEGRQIVVEASIMASAQTLSARKFGIRQSLAHLIIVRSLGYNKHHDRYTGAQV